MQRIVRGGVVACIGVAVVLGLVYLVRAVDRLGEAADTNAAANYDDREFAGGNSVVVDKRALYQARALIPEDGRYRVVAGPRVEGATELTEPFIEHYARYFLMPRRPSVDADWILCYGCNPADLDRAAELVWENGGGISILRVSG